MVNLFNDKEHVKSFYSGKHGNDLQLIKQELENDCKNILSTLERKVLKRRIKFHGGRTSLKTIGVEMHYSAERIRYIEARAIYKLEKYIEDKNIGIAEFTDDSPIDEVMKIYRWKRITSRYRTEKLVTRAKEHGIKTVGEFRNYINAGIKKKHGKNIFYYYDLTLKVAEAISDVYSSYGLRTSNITR
jgi:hypothetical protein